MPSPKIQVAWVWREAGLDFSNYPLPGWRVQVATEQSQPPQTISSFLKLSQSVINYVIRIENRLQVSNSFVQGLTVCLGPLNGPVLLMLSSCHRHVNSKTPLILG